MSTTLQTLVTEAAMYIKADLVTTGTPAIYDDDSADIVSKLISGINDAKNYIAMKKYPLYFAEDITLDANSSFAPSDTTSTFYKLISVSYNGNIVDAEYHNAVIVCDAPASAEVSVKYQHIPADMLKLKNLVNADNDDAYCFPDVVDYRILCYRAAQLFYEINGGTSARQKAQVWENKWLEALGKINMVNEYPDTIKDYYDINFNASAW